MFENTVLLLGLAFTFGATIVACVAIVHGRSVRWKSGKEIEIRDDSE